MRDMRNNFSNVLKIEQIVFTLPKILWKNKNKYHKGKPSFKKKKKIMENSIIGRGGSAMSNSIIQKNTVYINTRPLFDY